MHYRDIHLRRQEKPTVSIFIESHSGRSIQQKGNINEWQKGIWKGRKKLLIEVRWFFTLKIYC